VGELGLGSGVTADATPVAEYGECLHKGAFLAQQAEPLHLVETLRWHPRAGFSLLDRHLARLAASARALGFGCDPPALSRQLHGAVAAELAACKVRLLLAADGTATVAVSPLPKAAPAISPAWVALAATVIDPDEPLLYHKTTWRPWYDDALDQHPGCLDVLFRNRNGEVTEGTMHNLVVEAKGRLLTPPVACGLLPGTLRAELLARGILREARIDEAALRTATRLWLINSVRGWRRVRLT
jgi:para-aminobenzoate synthetase/4-amino-4-deoxychorismate lyase